jgi:hypothetical protein
VQIPRIGTMRGRVRFLKPRKNYDESGGICPG